MAIQGFDKEFYLNAKLAQLQSDSATAADWAGKDAAFLEARLLNGFGLTAEAHYEQYGYQEDLAPNAFFNPAEYIRAKATDMFNDPASTYLTIDEAAADFVAIWNGNVYNHYLQYGEEEGINPSNSFDVSAYLEAKLADLQAEEATAAEWAGKSVADVAAAFKDAGITALGHFTAYGQNEGLSAPAVPADEQVNVDTSVPGQVFTLTTGVDNLTGTDGDDTFNASWNTAANNPLGGLDVIDGGAGTDTLNIADSVTAATDPFALPAGFSVQNVENMNVTTNGNIGATGAGNSFDVSSNAAVTSIKGVAAGSVGSFVTASSNTNVDLTVAGVATATIAGGKAVSVTAGTGAVSVVGNALTDVTVKGGDLSAGSAIDNSATGTTLKSVTLNQVDGIANLRGNGIETVAIKGATAGVSTVNVANTTANHTLNVNVEGTGYTTATPSVEAQTVVADAAATTINVNGSGSKSSLALTGSNAVTTVNVTGAAELKLGVDLGTIKTIDGSTATGSLNLQNINAATTTVKTGAGNDQFTLAASKVTAETGAGNDSVTLNGAIAAGSSINLGAGNDKLLATSTGSVAASTPTATTVIDGGEGRDTVSASLINAGNAAQFVNFEALDLSAAVTNLDVELMTGSTIEGLTLTGGASTNATVSNVAAGVGLAVSGDNSGGVTTIGVKGATAAASTNDSFAIDFVGSAASTATATAKTAVEAGTVALAGVENVSIASSGEGFVANNAVITATSLQSLTITGDKDLDLDFGNGTGNATTPDAQNGLGVASIDGSSATGVLNINTTNVTAATAGLTVKTGSANDVITLGQKATVEAGAGNDTIISSVDGGTFTGGTGNDTFDISAAVAGTNTEATAVIANVVDFASGDSIRFDATAASFDSTKVDLDNSVQDLDGALALALNNATAGQINWFQYGADTYAVQNVDGAAGLGGTDIVVKLTGQVDLSEATLSTADLSLA